MRNWLPKIILLLAIVMCINSIALAVEMSPAPLPTKVVMRYDSKTDSTGMIRAHRPTIVGKNIVVTGPHHIVPQVVLDCINRGGNFWDAAVPGMWMSELTGGQLSPGTAVFDMWIAEEGKAKSYCGVGTAPGMATVQYFIDRFGDKIKGPEGYYYVPTQSSATSKAHENYLDDMWVRTIVSPSPDNMIALLIRYGTMSWAEAMQDVLLLMDEGWPLSSAQCSTAQTTSLFKEPMASYTPLNENRQVWRQVNLGTKATFPALRKEPGLARTIRGMMEAERTALLLGASREEALRAARDWYYTGPIAREIDRMNREYNGLMRYDDYASYSGRWFEQEELPKTNFLGVDFYTDHTYTQAAVLILTLNILENFDLVALGYNTPAYIHVITQAFDLAYSDRWQYFGDPLFEDVPKELWSKEYGTLRASLIDMNWRFQEVPPPGDPVNMKAVLEGWTPPVPPNYGKLSAEPNLNQMLAEDEYSDVAWNNTDTIFMNMIDKDGNIFTYCPSDGRESQAIIPGYGVSIDSRGRQFTLGDWPHSIEPGKRPVSTPHGWVAAKDGVGFLSAQTPGGDSQVQCALQIVLNYLLWNMPPQVALEQPRFETDNLFSMFTPYFQGNYNAATTNVDSDFPEETRKALEALGHKVVDAGKWAVGSRPMFVVRDPKTGLLMGASSVNGEGYCFGR